MQVIAHRGAKGYVSENTIAAFEKALEMNADGIELDVFLSADGHAIVFHDETLDRLTGVSGKIQDLTLDEIKTLKVDLKHDIPTLSEVFDFVDKRCLINIEIKAEAATNDVCDLIEKYVSDKNWQHEHFLVSSFDWPCLQQIRHSHPKIPLGVLTETDIDLAIGFAKSIGAETFHPYFHLLDETSVAKIKAENLKLYVWTVNEPEDITRIENLNIDGIITDFPDRA